MNKVLIVGGGIAGMAAAIRLCEHGHDVDLIDIDPQWRVYGAGITITGPTLRAYKRLGLLDEIAEQGAVSRGTRLFLFNGTPIATIDEPDIEDGVPGTGGILRPVLHKIMSARVRALGVKVRLGLTVDALVDDGLNVHVRFSDGSHDDYDLVIGADGYRSRVREFIFPDAVQPKYTGQTSWRVLAPRPEGADRGEIFLGHAHSVGFTNCARDQAYLFLLTADPKSTRYDDKDLPEAMRAHLKDFGGNAGKIRDGITADSSIVYRPLESALQPKPWHKGRIAIIGDAAHATTPHLASGAGIAVEDALILADELQRSPDDTEQALTAFTERRFDRCKMVVESSVHIGERQIAGCQPQEIGMLMGKALGALRADI